MKAISGFFHHTPPKHTKPTIPGQIIPHTSPSMIMPSFTPFPSIPDPTYNIVPYSDTKSGKQHILQMPSSYDSSNDSDMLKITFDNCKTGC